MPLMPASTPGDAVAREPELACALSENRWWSWCVNVLGHTKPCPRPWEGDRICPLSAPGCRSCGRVGSLLPALPRLVEKAELGQMDLGGSEAPLLSPLPGPGPPLAGCHHLSLHAGHGAGAVSGQARSEQQRRHWPHWGSKELLGEGSQEFRL